MSHQYEDFVANGQTEMIRATATRADRIADSDVRREDIDK